MTNIFENSNIFRHKYLLGHSFVSIFPYEYCRIFVYECVTVWNLLEYLNTFIYSYNFQCEYSFNAIFYKNTFGHLLLRYIWHKYIRIFIHVEMFTNITLWSWGPLGCTTLADITLTVYLPDSWYMNSLIHTLNIPQTSPRFHQYITKISPIYPPKYINRLKLCVCNQLFCLIFFPHSKQLNPVLPHYLHHLCTFQFIIFQCSDQNSKKTMPPCSMADACGETF